MAQHDPIPPDRAAIRAGPAQRAFARHFSANRRELSGDRRARRLAEHLPPDRRSAVAGLGAQRDGRSRAARPDLCAAYLRRPAADRARPAFLRRRLDAGRRPHRGRAAIDPEPARVRRPCAIGRSGAWRSPDPAVRPDPRGRRGADRQIQYAPQAYRVRAAGTRARAGRAGRRGRPGREPRPDLAARRSPVRADGSDQLPQRAHPRPHARRSAARARNRAGAWPRRARPVDAEGDRRRARELVGRRDRGPAVDRARSRQSARGPARAR